ncbi:MAG: L,D-transpeptidase [Chloroflexi bacterium]|nr:L,D-transpeptidase [Chloroflexota bacterium]
MLGEAPARHYFKLLEPQRGPRLWVEDPITSGRAYVEAESVGPVGPPPDSLVPPRWWGYVGVDDINVRTDPTDESAILGTLAQGLPVVVETWIEGEEVLNDQPGWAKLGEGVHIYGPLLRKARIETPPPMPSHGPLAARWIDVNLTQQTVTAYEDDLPVYLALTSSGRPGWETHEGVHEIYWRKEVETMDSASLLGQDASRASYRIENIRWTQYFTQDGQAFHENFWRDSKLFGIPSSHGCLGLGAGDARWFWEWAARGTPLSVHS